MTGAQLFDTWFDRSPTATREELLAPAGLDPARPYVLYVGSSRNIAPAAREIPFVLRWLEALRGDSDTAGLGVLVRPHPGNVPEWSEVELPAGAAVVPRRRPSLPMSEHDEALYYDSIHHSAAVVGINTSAMVESFIQRRPVLTIRSHEFAGTQDGTLHFRYLLPEAGGALRTAATIEAHLGQLRDTLADPGRDRERIDAFVRSFVRPCGLDRPATPILADAIEALGGLERLRRRRVTAARARTTRGGRVFRKPASSRWSRSKRNAYGVRYWATTTRRAAAPGETLLPKWKHRLVSTIDRSHWARKGLGVPGRQFEERLVRDSIRVCEDVAGRLRVALGRGGRHCGQRPGLGPDVAAVHPDLHLSGVGRVEVPELGSGWAHDLLRWRVPDVEPGQHRQDTKVRGDGGDDVRAEREPQVRRVERLRGFRQEAPRAIGFSPRYSESSRSWPIESISAFAASTTRRRRDLAGRDDCEAGVRRDLEPRFARELGEEAEPWLVPGSSQRSRLRRPRAPLRERAFLAVRTSSAKAQTLLPPRID